MDEVVPTIGDIHNQDRTRPQIQCYPPENAEEGIIYAAEGDVGAFVHWADATATADTGIKR